ncbi:MAG: kelch repeat-containing protein [Planctomycetota bacterium]
MTQSISLAIMLLLVSQTLAEAPNNKTAGATARLHRPLPESLTSFGAAVLGEHLYVFSGHSGVAHGFGKDLLVDHFRRIRFDDPEAEWEELAMHEPAQSVALVTDGTHLYRIAGLSFLDAEGDSSAPFNSTSHFARYDVAKNEWEKLPDLPAPRSSLDAAVVGRWVYVVGGWNLQGASSRSAPWHEDILRFNLDDPDAGWESIEGPGYKTRALSAAAHDNKLFVIGGIQDRGITRKVSIFDPQTDQWSEGPELPADSSTAGFATSAFAVGSHLYCTGNSGVVYRMKQDQSGWENADRLFYPRMFLRLLPVGEDRLIALGGTGSIGRTSVVESLTVKPASNPQPKSVSWSVDFGGRAKHSQAVVLNGGKLYAFGGNGSREAHDFSKEAFVDEAFVFDLGNQSVEALPKMPQAMQSGAAFLNALTSEHRVLTVVGGLGPGEERMQYLQTLLTFDPESEEWATSSASLPQPRSMFQLTTYDDAIWMFGGSAGRAHGLSDDVLHWWGDDTAIAPLSDIQVPAPRRSFGGASHDGKYYMVGGLGGGMQIADTVDVFDFDTRSWSSIAAPEVPRVFPSLVATSDKLYLFGGFTNTTGHFSPATTLEAYDFEQESWTTIASDSFEATPSMKMLEFNGRLLFYGIDEEFDGQANFVLFDPEPSTVPGTVAPMSFGGSRRSRAGEAEETAKMMIRKDVNKDGKLSKEELGSRMAGLVDAGDSDGDGLLSKQETIQVLKAEAEAAETEADAESTEAEAQESQTTKVKLQSTTDVDKNSEQDALVGKLEKIADQAQKAAEEAQAAAQNAKRLLQEARDLKSNK